MRGILYYPYEEEIEAANEKEAEEKFRLEMCKDVADMAQPYTCIRSGRQKNPLFFSSGDFEIEWIEKKPELEHMYFEWEYDK
jgi:hypothetical protein